MTDLVVESCDPRDRADDLRALFARNDQPEFAQVFERVYRPRAEHGLRSWVGSIDGQVVMHVSITPHRFGDGTRKVMAGILGDLMVDAAHRDFWLPLRLLRTAVKDVRADGGLGFLLTTTIPDSASLFKAGGFKPFGGIRRHVLPLVRPYLLWSRLRGRARALPVRVVVPSASDFAGLMSRLPSSGAWRPEPCAEFYATRIPRHDYADATWLEVGSGASGPDGLVLVSRHAKWPELGIGDAFWRHGRLADVAASVARWARTQRVSKLSVSVVGGRAEAELRRAGFVARPYEVPLLVQSLGDGAPPPVDWFMTALAGSAW